MHSFCATKAVSIQYNSHPKVDLERITLSYGRIPVQSIDSSDGQHALFCVGAIDSLTNQSGQKVATAFYPCPRSRFRHTSIDTHLLLLNQTTDNESAIHSTKPQARLDAFRTVKTKDNAQTNTTHFTISYNWSSHLKRYSYISAKLGSFCAAYLVSTTHDTGVVISTKSPYSADPQP